MVGLVLCMVFGYRFVFGVAELTEQQGVLLVFMAIVEVAAEFGIGSFVVYLKGHK